MSSGQGFQGPVPLTCFKACEGPCRATAQPNSTTPPLSRPRAEPELLRGWWDSTPNGAGQNLGPGIALMSVPSSLAPSWTQIWVS